MNVATHPSVSLPPVSSTRSEATLRFSSPLTARGLALTAFSVYLFAGPVSGETDIVAAVLATTLLFLVATLLALTVVSGARLKRELEVALSFPEGDEGSTAGSGACSLREVGCLLKVPALSIWPLYVLSLRLSFEEGELVLPLHRITGSFDAPTFLPQPITFPHRGRWRLKKIDCTFGDQFGLSQLRWSTPTDPTRSTITVRPPRPVGDSLPVITSCQRSGDLITDLHERRGDLFDLKPYHPADGMRRIVWKIFARRGELIARQPEASMTPEGQAVIFCLAGDEDDAVCGATLSYIDLLQSLGIETYVGTEGMGQHPPTRTTVASEGMMIDAVWQAQRIGAHELTAECDTLIARARELLGSGTSLDRLLLFVSARRLGVPAHAAWVTEFANHLAASGITPTFFVLDTGATLQPQPESLRGISRWLTVPAPRRRSATSTPAVFDRFCATASRSGWQVIRFGGER